MYASLGPCSVPVTLTSNDIVRRAVASAIHHARAINRGRIASALVEAMQRELSIVSAKNATQYKS
jgi:hypothetical protein